MADLEAVVPSTPRSGSYLPVVGLTNQDEGAGGDIRVELEQCGQCYLPVERTAFPDHESWHESLSGAEPKSK
jgi:hypothetical protein